MLSNKHKSIQMSYLWILTYSLMRMLLCIIVYIVYLPFNNQVDPKLLQKC